LISVESLTVGESRMTERDAISVNTAESVECLRSQGNFRNKQN